MADDEEKARAEAEARRKRILEKSKDRMTVVSGLQAEADTEDEETKASSAARMQAMRRRRFKKGGKGKDTTAAADEDTTAAADDDDAAAPSEVAAPAAAPAEKSKPVAEEQEKVSAPEPEPETPTSADEATTGGGEKKYKGVAKMRREMLQKKKQEQQAKEQNELADEHPMARKRKLKPPMLPVLMYLLTVVLLFLAGLDIGFQHYDDTCLVHHTSAISQFDVRRLNPFSSNKGLDMQKNFGYDDDDRNTRVLLEDEFESAGGHGDEYVPNIDPIFRVDLNELTRGPGIFLQLARGAVRIHQLLMAIPLQILSVPKALFQFPPVMCLVAITLRQLVAKLVLGATLPDPQEEDVRKQKDVPDILDMVKNYVMGMLTTSFPTAVTLFETFRDLRSDMYVLLCGMFVGLAYSSMMTTQTLGGSGDFGYEEVVAEPGAAPVPTGGLGEEL